MKRTEDLRQSHYSTLVMSVLAVIALLGGVHQAQAQWSQPDSTTGNIYSTNTGNVGVGTQTPATSMHVKKTATGGDSEVMRLENGDTSAYVGAYQSFFFGSYEGARILSKNNNDGFFNLRFFTYNAYTGGLAERMALLGNGNLGIGTTTPTSRLHLAGDNTSSGGYALIKLQNTQSGGDHSWWLYSGALGVPGAFGLYDATAGAYRMFFDGSGNLGIGTTSPLAQLHLGTTSNNGLKTYTSSATDHGLLFNSYIDSNAPYRRYADIVAMSNQDGTSGGSTIRFLTNPNNSFTATERMRIDYLGNVGIGTNGAPSYRLDVRGGEINAHDGLCIGEVCKYSWDAVGGGGSSSSQWSANTGGSTGINYNSGSVGIGTASPSLSVSGTVLHLNNATASNAAIARFTNGTTGATATDGFITGMWTDNNAYLWSYEANALVFGTSSTERLRIDSSGNVGIGTPTPDAAYKLDVNGAAHIKNDLIVDGNVTAKYQDVAEWVPSKQRLAAGTVVILNPDKNNEVMASATAYDTRVAGVVSARPGLALGEAGTEKSLVATTGRVKVKVDATRAPIHVGDLLVTSDKEGVAMKSEPIDVSGVKLHRPGTLIGKALEPLESGTGEILVLLSLQ